MTLLAGVVGRVPRVELGTAVLLPALRSPVLLPHQMATLDQVSEGRFILGVGIARDVPNIRAEFAAAGVPVAGLAATARRIASIKDRRGWRDHAPP